MAHNKMTQRALVYDRLNKALENMYHNATVKYPIITNKYEEKQFDNWFQYCVRDEISYIQDGGAHGPLPKISRSMNKVEYYKNRKRIRDIREDRSKYAMWEYINEYGTLYQYGRGGRTLAPEYLVKGDNYWRIKNTDDLGDMSYAEAVRIILIIESFNHMVEVWCNSIPESWNDYKKEYLQDMSEEEYIDNKGLVCPFCRGKDVKVPEHFDVGEEYLYLYNVECGDCEATWTEKYKLIGYEKDEE